MSPLFHLRSRILSDNGLSFDLWLEGSSNLENFSLSVVDLVQIARNVLSNQNISLVYSFIEIEFLHHQNNKFLFGILRVYFQKLLQTLHTNSVIQPPCLIFLRFHSKSTSLHKRTLTLIHLIEKLHQTEPQLIIQDHLLPFPPLHQLAQRRITLRHNRRVELLITNAILIIALKIGEYNRFLGLSVRLLELVQQGMKLQLCHLIFVGFGSGLEILPGDKTRIRRQDLSTILQLPLIVSKLDQKPHQQLLLTFLSLYFHDNFYLQCNQLLECI